MTPQNKEGARHFIAGVLIGILASSIIGALATLVLLPIAIAMWRAYATYKDRRKSKGP